MAARVQRNCIPRRCGTSIHIAHWNSILLLETKVMSTVVHERFDVAPLSGFRISWGGIWAGVLTVMGTLMFLTTLSKERWCGC